MTISKIEFGTEAYLRAVELRREVLRKPLGLDYTPEQLAEEEDVNHFLAECGFDPLGSTLAYAMSLPEDDRTIRIKQVAVRQDLQGKGIGSQIMEFVENHAKALGFEQALLHSRDYAIPFYRKMGYTEFGDEFVEVGIPHRKMIKNL